MTESVKNDDSQDGRLAGCRMQVRPCQYPYCFCSKSDAPLDGELEPFKSFLAKRDRERDIQPYDPQTW